MAHKIMGHTFLAKLGKKRLRPGGVRATKWLLSQVAFNNKKILEVACNQGTTAIEIVKKYNCKLSAIDKDVNAVKAANAKIQNKKISEKLEFLHGNAFALKFKDQNFDIIINEAMLSMLNDEGKKRALCEYKRVLKKDGVLLTHDICVLTDDVTIQKEISEKLSDAINIQVTPKTISEWKEIIMSAGFQNLLIKTGNMSLLNPIGMIRDEGVLNTFKIIWKARKKENKTQFKKMFRFFKKYKQYLGFIAIASNF